MARDLAGMFLAEPRVAVVKVPDVVYGRLFLNHLCRRRLGGRLDGLEYSVLVDDHFFSDCMGCFTGQPQVEHELFALCPLLPR